MLETILAMIIVSGFYFFIYKMKSLDKHSKKNYWTDDNTFDFEDEGDE